MNITTTAGLPSCTLILADIDPPATVSELAADLSGG